MSSQNISQEASAKFCIDDFYASLVKATEEAGGSFSFRVPERITLKDLAELLAPNGVRFTFIPTRSVTNVESYQAFRFKNPCVSVPVARPVTPPADQGYVHPNDRGMGRP